MKFREHSGRVLDSRLRGRGFEPHQCHCVASSSKNINLSLVLVQPRKTRPFIIERLFMGRKESKQTNKHEVHIQIILNTKMGFRRKSFDFCKSVSQEYSLDKTI